MKKDYSEYKHTDYEKYNIARQSNSYVYYDFFINFASFDPDSKLFSIKVDRVNEDLSMKEAIDEFEELEIEAPVSFLALFLPQLVKVRRSANIKISEMVFCLLFIVHFSKGYNSVCVVDCR